MGRDLVAEAVAKMPTWKGLSPRAYAVLTRMCLTAFDHDKGDQPARLYYGGWKPLALMLGYPADDGPMDPAAKRAVARAIQELVDVGAIDPADAQHPGPSRHRAYWITH